MHTVEEVFEVLHSLEIREPLRRFQPKIIMVAVNVKGDIIKFERLKESPRVEDLHRFGDEFKEASFFIAHREHFTTLEEFRRRIQESCEAIRRRVGGRN